jgi:DNA gyrase subunit A
VILWLRGRAAHSVPRDGRANFSSRASTGVRGIGRPRRAVDLNGRDPAFRATADERTAYLQIRRAVAGLADDAELPRRREANANATIDRNDMPDVGARI